MQMQPEAIPQEAGPSQGDALLISAPVQHKEKVKSLRQNYRPKDHPKHHHIGNKKHQSVC
ncbi:TPA: hypothetical protein ACH3X3_011804 [Trebouxia sp. C0006]